MNTNVKVSTPWCQQFKTPLRAKALPSPGARLHDARKTTGETA
jgi:hypothetical protein